MPIAVYFHHPNLTLEQFDEVDRRVHEATGGAEPGGLIHHSVYGPTGTCRPSRSGPPATPSRHSASC